MAFSLPRGRGGAAARPRSSPRPAPPPGARWRLRRRPGARWPNRSVAMRLTQPPFPLLSAVDGDSPLLAVSQCDARAYRPPGAPPPGGLTAWRAAHRLVAHHLVGSPPDRLAAPPAPRLAGAATLPASQP